eukprot:TRINITY_DN43276_c0_g1_i1.p1 TRINITY_DN43276_c0_g1~~TRINITY_DN43276_c0_g1_i1.p1  ORF type:complete len:349 (+),score=90.26 TRINITY_DN43276_c0_g1_i1:30-1076(+)
MASGSVEGLLAVAACFAITPLACKMLWTCFGGSFIGCLAPKEFSDTSGQSCVFMVYIMTLSEACIVAVWCGLPYIFGSAVFDAPDVTQAVQTLPDRLGAAVEAIESGRALLPLLHIGLYNAVLLLFYLSYYRAGDTASDALFTIDRQKNEVICDRCSRLVHTHTQHCSFCWRCIDRFDHHSFFINNCVGERNVKHYTLSLVYNEVRCVLAASILLPRLFAPPSPTTFLVGCAFCWVCVSFAAVGFLLAVWALAVTYGFNSSTFTGKHTPDGTSSLEILDSVLGLMSPMRLPSRSELVKALRLPDLTSQEKRKNWEMLMGVGSKWHWWWPSSPYKFPDYGQHAFVFKRG